MGVNTMCRKHVSFMAFVALLAIVGIPAGWVPAASAEQLADYQGDAERGRLVFAQCRTCHYPEKIIGHHNGPNLHAIFGKVAGKQEGFDDYSETFKGAEFTWTPELLFTWLADVEAMFPETTMMSLGVPDPQQRADLIAYLAQFK